MDTKLTLKLDKNIIERAKIYAANKKISLSWMFENHIKSVTSLEKTNSDVGIKISNLAKSFTISEEEANISLDYKKDLQEILIKKFG